MRKFKKLFVVTFIIFLSIGTTYNQAQNKFNINDRVQSNNSSVNVRVNPGTTQTSVGSLNLGDKGTVTSGPSAYTSGYYWYKASFDKGIQGWVAQDFLEKIVTPPGAFTLTLTPECDGTTSQIRLNWTSSSGATSYEIYRNGTLIYTPTSNQFINTTVTTGVSYSYYVKAKNSGGSTNSNTLSATAPNCGVNPPGAFTLTLTPECDGTASQIRLNWTSSPGAKTYDVYRNGTLLYSDAISNQFINTTVTTGVSYSYYVKAKNSGGSTNSNTLSATAANCASPCIPISFSSYPIDQTVSMPASASFSVIVLGTSPTYQWEYSTNNGSTWSNVPNSSPYNGITSATLNINQTSSQMNGFKYRCKIGGSCTTNVWSNWVTLTVNSPFTIVSTSPSNGELATPVTNSITATFNKEIQAGSLSVRVVDASAVSVAVKSVTISNNRILNISLLSNLKYATGYSVEINAGAVKDLTSSQNTAYSWAFVTAAAGAPAKPILNSPLDNAVSIPSTTILKWNVVNTANKYILQVSKDLLFTDKIFDQTVNGNSQQINLTQGTQYFWRVLAALDQTIGPWSDIWKFTTATASKISLSITSIEPLGVQTRDWSQNVIYTINVKDQNGNSISEAKITGQDEISGRPFDTNLTGADGKITYTSGAIPVGTINGAIFNLTFKAIKTGYTDSPILSRQVKLSHAQTPATFISINPVTPINFSSQYNGGLPNSQTVTFTNTGVGTLNWTISSIPSWLNITPTSGTSNTTQVQIRPNTTNLNPNQSPYSADIQVTSTNATNSPQKINVRYEIQASASPTQLTFGSVTIKANSFTDIGNGKKRASGNISINNILKVDGTLDIPSISSPEADISGTGEIFVDQIPPQSKKVLIHKGAFNFHLNGNNKKLESFKKVSTEETLKLAGCRVEADNIQLYYDGISLEGTIYINIYGNIIPYDLQPVEIRKSTGITLENFLLAPLHYFGTYGLFPIKELTISYNSERDVIIGTASISLSSYDNFLILSHGFSGVSTSLGIKDGRLDSFDFTISGKPGIPIIPLGPSGFSIALYGGGGEISGLVKPPLSVGFHGDFAIKEPPPLPEILSELVQIEHVGLTLSIPFELSGSAKVKLVDYYELANASLYLNTSKLTLNGYVNFADIIKGNIELTTQWRGEILVEGHVNGDVQIPDGDGDLYDLLKSFKVPFPIPLLGVEAKIKNFSAYLTPKIGPLNLTVGIDLNKFPPKPKLGINFLNHNWNIFGNQINPDLARNFRNRFEGLSLTISRDNPNKYLSKSSSVLFQTIPIKTDFSQLIFKVSSTSGVLISNLIRPDGISLEFFNLEKLIKYNVQYAENSSKNEVFWIINNPMKGDWQIQISGNTNSLLDVIGSELPCVVNIIEPSSDKSSGQIEWIDSAILDSTKISLYYDNDNLGQDGILIASNLKPVNGRNSYNWNYINISPGSYYVYATIDDGQNAQRTSYSSGRVIVTSNLPKPSAFTATIVDTTIVLKWNPPSNSGSVLQGFLIRYKDENSPSLQGSILAQDTNEIVFNNLIPGRNYQFSIASIGTGGNTSDQIWSNSVNYISKEKNNVPSLKVNFENALNAKIYSPYTVKAIALDPDGDGLLFSLMASPAGMNINSLSGEINWTPTLDQIGSHDISLRVSDGKGGIDSLKYSLNVEQPTGPVITFSRSTYSLSQSLAIISVLDNDANQNSLVVDEINVNLKYKNTTGRIILRESQANNGIFMGSIDLKEFSLTVGDTVLVTYINQIGKTVSVPLVWEASATKVDQEIILPNVFELSQNYPNPFNPITKIKYSIPSFSKVTLKIFDILGREVLKLVDEEKNPGVYIVEFKANHLASGVYFYQIRAGDFIFTKKLVLLK